ncbi:Intercellular adhesion molecule 1 [Channa argus]|uniref:Intercellular adhesion molecule 1 n=1 Tax=Channa argus TaxID=215402 RepID=A0A6G1PCS7_CHAAH|nr:Intercellular adhesion molecule 1 [Channa argus]
MMLTFIIWAVCLMTLKRDVYVSSCDFNCKDKPVFTPSILLVKHGGPTSATCSVCQSGCTDSFGLEKSVGTTSKNGNTIKWTVDKMTEWEPSPFCYYNDPKIPDKQCCTKLPITVYKLPDSVSISIFNHTGLMYEGHQYTLQCEVKNVAPIQNLSVTFYRGNTPLGQPQSVNNPAKKPANETYSQSINASKEDDGAQYWCEAKLELGPEGRHLPLVEKSENITTSVNSNAVALISSLSLFVVVFPVLSFSLE